VSALTEKQHLVKKMAARKSGTAVTFTKVVEGSYDSSTNTFSGGSTSTVTGYAEQVAGDPERYRALELVETEAPTLDFTPDTYNEEPAQDSTVSWGGVTFKTRDVASWKPAGEVISSSVVVVRG
jgi:hypothetical protein